MPIWTAPEQTVDSARFSHWPGPYPITSLSRLSSILIRYIFCDLSIGRGSSQTSGRVYQWWRLLPAVVSERALIPQKSKAGPRHQSWRNYWMNLIGSLYGPWWKQYVTLKARLLAPSALCVSPINLYAPPSPLPFYVQLKATIQMSRSSDAKGVWHVIGSETATRRYAIVFPPGDQREPRWYASLLVFHQRSI